ncbi:MAG: HAD family hydrolase [Alphaproteobacteria bacterium]|nr:HAD family hydrolase [Alphaproteobacteria bacterium]
MIIDDFMKYASHYDVLIFDINGVLDNNHDAKVKMLSDAFPDLSKLQVAEINVGMERAYEKSKNSSTASHIASACAGNGIVIDDSKAEELSKKYYELNRIKPEIIKFLNKLSETNKVCLYTSLSREKVDSITSRYPLSSKVVVFAREDQVESKPSIRNLEIILQKLDVPVEKAILFGDNVAVDIMPAHLLGIKTVLVSNYVDDVVKL